MSEKRQTSKIFVGGLSWETTDQRLRTYFENYGAVSEAFVSFDRTTGRPRGFGFVVFEDPAVADKVVSLQHTVDRRDVEAKKAVPKEEQPTTKPLNGLSPQRTKKIFVGGLAPSVDELAFRKYFEQYGPVEDAVVMYDHDNKRPRGFGFVTFASEDGVDAVFTGGSLQTLHDKPIEIKRAVPRDQIASARGRPAFSQQPRLFTTPQQTSARSGFAAAAMGPAFGGDNPPLHGSLLGSHSVGAPQNTQSQMSRLTEAHSLGAQGLPPFSHDLGAISQGLAAGILNAMSAGQLPSQMSAPPGSLAAQLQQSAHATGGSGQHVPGGQLHSGHLQGSTGGAQLQALGSSHLQDLLRPMGSIHGSLHGSNALQGMGSSQLQQLGGGSQLQSSGSGLLQKPPHASQAAGPPMRALQGNYGIANGDILGPEFNHQHFRQHSAPFNAAPSAGLETAFGAMALDTQRSFGTELPPPNGFEERVNMLSAGSAGLGQLPSPKVTAPFPHLYPGNIGSSSGRDVGVSSQQW